MEGVLPIAGLRGERLFVFGIDLLIDFFIRDYHFAGASFGFDAALDFIAQPDSIALTESLSRRLDLPVGSRLSLTTSTGIRSYTVRVLLKEEGAAKVFGGNFALMDLPVAQIALGKEGKIDLVDLTVEHGEDVETIQRRIQERLEGAAQVERPSDRGEQIESLLASFRIGLFFVSLIALFVGFSSSTIRCLSLWFREGGRSAPCAAWGWCVVDCWGFSFRKPCFWPCRDLSPASWPAFSWLKERWPL